MPKSEMKNKHTLVTNEELLRKFQALPVSRSSAIAQSIHNAGLEPELLARALQFRMTRPQEENTIKTTYTRDPKLTHTLQHLCERSQLAGEQVVRLCMEAYIYRL